MSKLPRQGATTLPCSRDGSHRSPWAGAVRRHRQASLSMPCSCASPETTLAPDSAPNRLFCERQGIGNSQGRSYSAGAPDHRAAGYARSRQRARRAAGKLVGLYLRSRQLDRCAVRESARELTGSAGRIFVGQQVEDLVGGQGAEFGGAAPGHHAGGDLLVAGCCAWSMSS
jgi:hypothetical protein